MPEQKWTAKWLFEEATELATRRGDTLTVRHFHMVADRELPGKRIIHADPTEDYIDLVERGKKYLALDLAFRSNATDKTDPDVAAACRRLEIFERVFAQSPTTAPPHDFLRFMCRTNLMFLAREVFNRDLTFTAHAPVTNFFVQKDPSKTIEQQEEHDGIMERLLLYPRGAFKSTIDVIDCVQWFINFPNIRILVLAAADDLAESFIGELKNYFFVPKAAKPTNFQTLFPEWTLASNTEGAADEFICPCRTVGDEKKKDPSAWSKSILANLPGWHCDLMKVDDAVNDKNSATPILIKKVISKVNFAESLIDPGGYKDLLGTPYAGSDLYNASVEAASEFFRKLVTPARWLRPEAMHKDERDCKETDYELLFEVDKIGRKRLTHSFLNAKRSKDFGIYSSQYMLNPSGTRKVKFSLELLTMRTIPYDQVPHDLKYYIFWDFAYGVNQSNDYSVGAVIGMDKENRGYLVELFRDHYLDSDLAHEIVASYQKYQPRLVCIENSNGAQFLEQTIRRYAEEAGVSYIPLDFFKVDRSPNAKASRIGALQPYFLNGQLFIVQTVSYLDELYKEFKDFGVAAHDDIADAISHWLRMIPNGIAKPDDPTGTEAKRRREELDRKLQEKEFYDLIYGQGDYAPAVVEQPIAPPEGTGDTSGSELYDPYGIPGMLR
jgi:predicted phage terminase large subunit-like protein